jgi:hypothetical protein
LSTVTDIQCSDIALQADITATQIQVSDICLQTEFTSPDIKVSDICLQAEITLPSVKVSDLQLQTEFIANSMQVSDLTLQVDVKLPEPTIYTTFPGMYVKIYLNSELKFTGVVNDTETKRDQNTYFQTVNCSSLNNVPTRRNIKIEYSEGTTASSIVSDMVEDYLSLEGIEEGEISNGVNLQDEWKNELINISDVLDELSSRSGFQWFIDKDMKLNFYQEATTVSVCTYSIKDNDVFGFNDFYDFRDFVVNETIENYVNKVFCLGANDDHGDLIYTINGDLTKQNEMQYVCGGTGVYGLVHRNSAMNGHDYYICEASTDTDTVYYTAHNMKVGDYFWNVTRDAYSYVTIILSADHFQCEAISGQTAGDTLEVYREVNDVGTNILKRQYTLPQKIQFKSHAIEFEPSTRLTVSIADMGLNAIYNIDEVLIKELSKTVFETTVNAVRRTNENFSTQKEPTYLDYFRGF